MEAAEGAADEGFGGGGGFFVEDGADGFAGIDLFVAEGDEGEFGIGGLGGDLAGRGVLPGVGDADFVFEFQDDAFGGFFSDAFGFGKQCRVARDDRGFEHVHGHAAEDGDGDGGADPGDAVDQEEENIPLLLGGETEERVGVFSDVEVGSEIDRRALGRVELVESGNRDDGLVADPVAVHDQPVRVGFDDVSSESRDHRGGFGGNRPGCKREETFRKIEVFTRVICIKTQTMSEKEEEIVVCHSCGAPMNIASVAPYSRVVCPQCGEQNRVKKQFGPYVVKRRHAIGGMSSVFVANDETLDREVALKILSVEYSTDEKRIAAFEQEARLTASLSHPNIVRVFTTGRAFGWFYIAMEFVPGGHFEHRIRERGKIPEIEMLPIAIQIAEGLKGAQSAGLIHRDIKPGNILFDSEGNAKIVDFGLALVTKGGKAKATEIWATPFYVPPEAIEGGVEDFRADVYAFGATLYHALAGVPPCSEESMSTDLLKAAKTKIVPLKKVAPELTDETCAVISRAMAYEPIKRYGSYDDMIAGLRRALKAAQGELSEDAMGVTKAERRAQLRARKKRKIFATVSILSIVVAGILSMILIRASSQPDSSESKPAVVEVEKAETENPSGHAQEIASRYMAARRALEKGEFERAERMFSGLLKNDKVQEPTRTWAGLEAVSSAFMDGRTPDALRHAKTVEEHIGSEPFGLDRGFYSGVRPVLRELDELPFIGQKLLEGTSGGDQRFFGYMLAGLKNWEQGGIEQAVPFFRKVVAESSLAEHGVLGWYQKAAKLYLKDHGALTSGPLDVVPSAPGECERIIGELNEMLTLLETRGRARFNIRSRQLDLARQAKLLREPRPSERKQPDEFSKKIESLAGNYRFDKIAKLVSGLENDPQDFEREALLGIANAAQVFFSDIESELSGKPSGILLKLKDGVTVNSLVITDEGRLLGRLESGGTKELEWTDFTTGNLIELHGALFGNPDSETERLRTRESLIAFEWLAGDRERAIAAAKELSAESPEFEERWKMFSQGAPNR